MKHLTLIKTIFLIQLLSIATARAQTGPCLRVSTDTWTTCPAQTVLDATTFLPSNLVVFNVAEPNADLESNPGARYKAFWMFGDGNFKWYGYGTPEQDLSTMSHTHLYENPGTYFPVVVLSERKSNTTPPKKPKRSLSIQGMNVAPPPGGNFQPQIPTGRSMNIFNHDYNRPHYPTVFVVSAKPGNELSRIYFFYNSKSNNRGGYEPINIHNRLDTVYFPHYFPSTVNYSTSPTAATAWPAQLSELQTILASQFGNFLVVSSEKGGFKEYEQAAGQMQALYQNREDNSRISPPQEIRIFPELLSTWDDNWINLEARDTSLPKGYYLALAVGSTPVPAQDPNLPNSPNPLFGEVLQYFPNLDRSTLQCGSGAYIQGIATAEVDMVASIDPNGLTVLEICPLGNDKFKVKIRMEVCNEGYMHEQNFGLNLKDHTGQISKPNFISGKTPKFLKDSADVWLYVWEVFLDGVPLPNESAQSREQARKLCETAEFEVKTNWSGVQKIVRGEGLELCVKFEHARKECTKNYKVDEDFCKECGYACTSESGCKCQDQHCTILQICLLVILVIILLWWILKGRSGSASI